MYPPGIAPAIAKLAVWSNENDLNTTRGAGAGSGSSTSGLLSGGFAPPHSAATEEWNADGIITETID